MNTENFYSILHYHLKNKFNLFPCAFSFHLSYDLSVLFDFRLSTKKCLLILFINSKTNFANILQHLENNLVQHSVISIHWENQITANKYLISVLSSLIVRKFSAFHIASSWLDSRSNAARYVIRLENILVRLQNVALSISFFSRSQIEFSADIMWNLCCIIPMYFNDSKNNPCVSSFIMPWQHSYFGK